MSEDERRLAVPLLSLHQFPELNCFWLGRLAIGYFLLPIPGREADPSFHVRLLLALTGFRNRVAVQEPQRGGLFIVTSPLGRVQTPAG